MNDLMLRSWRIRLRLLQMFSHGKPHHFGGSLSCVDLVTALYFYKMNYSRELMSDPRRDRFIMSKGHSVPTQYVILAMLGIIPDSELDTIKTLGGRLQGHPDVSKTPGIEAPTGSLGMGLSFANGIALAARMDRLDFNVYLVLGDGELQEGQVWEAAMTTAHYRLNNVCAIVDNNGIQSQGQVKELMCVDPLDEKWKSFGWDVVKVDGHDHEQICSALDRVNGRQSRPLAIIAKTVKGKGVSFLENTYKCHNNSLTRAEYDRAEREILEAIRNLE